MKNIVLAGFGHITLLDLDTIDLSNLNRQFLFRKKDVKQSKALVCPGLLIARMHTNTVLPGCRQNRFGIQSQCPHHTYTREHQRATVRYIMVSAV